MSLTTKPNLHDNDALLTYRVGPVLCCGPTLPIITITPPPKLTHPPGTQPAEPGIFKHGTDIVSATDLRYRFGVKQQNWKQPGQVIIAKHNDTARGYFVDKIIDVTHFPETGWGQLPAYLPRGIFSRILVINKKIYLYAEFDKLSQLQGSNYLSEYIAQLENQLEKENKTVAHNIELNTHTDKRDQPVLATALSKEELPVKSLPGGNLSLKNLTKKPLTEKNNNQINKSIAANKNQTELKHQPNNPVDVDSKAETRINTIKTKSPEKQNLTSILIFKKDNNTKNLTPVAAKNEMIPDKLNTPLYKEISTSPIKAEQTNKEFLKNIHSTKQFHNRISPDKNISTSPDNTETELTKNRTTTTLNTTNIETDNTNHTLSWIGLFILLSTGGYYYLSTPTSLENDVITETLLNPEPVDNTLPTNANTSSSHPLTTDITSTSNKDNLSSPTTKIINKAPVSIAKQLTTTKTSRQKINSQNKPLKNNEYHANINQDNNTITIELNGPLPPKIITTEPDSTNTNSVIQQRLPEKIAMGEPVKEDTNDNTTNDSIAKQTQSNDQQRKIQQNNSTKNKTIKIIHIIVKGDTLWAIAKHYLQNPFLYPELAKLSRIKNPDLIYPGNRVHIIYHHN